VIIAPELASSGAVTREWLMLAAAFFAVIGHMFSVFVSFAGGKGVATTRRGLSRPRPVGLALPRQRCLPCVRGETDRIARERHLRGRVSDRLCFS